MGLKTFLKRDIKRVIILSVLIVLTAFFLILGTAFGIKSCTGTDRLLSREASDFGASRNTTQVGASYKLIGTAERNKPVGGMRDGGLDNYPVYGRTTNYTAEQKSAILAENATLCAGDSTYDRMDKDGYLYLNGEAAVDANGEKRRLYKHSASIGMYGGDVSDVETGVVKQMTFRHRSYNGYYEVTGLYAPAGEVIAVSMSEADMKATGGITIHIGQALYNGQANNIWAARDFNRMPVILNTMNMTETTSELENGVYTCYVGSFLGGPIYIRDEAEEYTVTVSGAVNYRHYIFGVTTEEEFEKLSLSTAPYFDLEVWESGVLHSGPKSGAAEFDYEQLTEAARLWEKVSSVSTEVIDQGIVFIYDPFVAAGAAVAFPGRRSVNCPTGWMKGSLDYDGFAESGSWGNMHEYHHNFQSGWGFGYTGEVTNNALNLVSYSLFTKVSSGRSVGGYGAAGLSGWNRYTSATWALNNVNVGAISSTEGLAVYATLLHNLGQDAFIKSKAAGAEYLDKWSENTHLDFSYYAGLVESYSGVSPSQLAANDYPAFVPISCVYQTGRCYVYDGEKKYIETMQPYSVPMDEPFTVDLRPYIVDESGQYSSGSIVIGKGLSYRIKNVVADGINGTLEKTETADVYTYTPDGDKRSGKILVTAEIIDDGNVLGGKDADDVEIALEFAPSRYADRFVLDRTVYKYGEGSAPSSAEKAYTDGYAGSTDKTQSDNVNVRQNSNTDVWLYEADAKPDGASDTVVRTPDSVIEVSGKLYFPTAGRYRVVLRGRWNAALFVSLDGGKTYKLGAKLDKAAVDKSPDFSFEKPDYYYDFYTSEITGEESGWLYFKSVLSVKQGSFMGLGVAQWTVPQYTTATEFDASGNVIKTHYYDSDGKEVSAEQAQNVQPIEPTDPKAVSYATAYRVDYFPASRFESEYFYTKEYDYTYPVAEGEAKGIMVSPDDGIVTYKGDWRWDSACAKFGHVNIGKNKATAEFSFEGSRFIVTGNGSDYKVYIDGRKTPSEHFDAETNASITYISPKLGEGNHKAVIVCNGETNIESMVFSSDYAAVYDGGEYKPSAAGKAWKIMLWLALAFAVAFGIAVLVFVLIDRRKDPEPVEKSKKRANKSAAKSRSEKRKNSSKSETTATKTAPKTAKPSKPASRMTTTPSASKSAPRTTVPTVVIQPIAKPTATPATAKPAAKTVTPTTSKPAAKTATPPTAKPAAKTATPSTAKPAAKTVTPPTAKPAAKTVTPTTSKPAAKTATPSTAKPATKTATPPTAKPAARTATTSKTKDKK